MDITTNPSVVLYSACEDEDVDDKLFRLEVKASNTKHFDSDAVNVVSSIAKRSMGFSIESLRGLECENFNDEPDVAYLLHGIKYEKPRFQNVIDLKDIERVFCAKPMLDSPCIIRQSGISFLYGINSNKSKPAQLNFRYKVYIINKAQKQKIRKQLEALGIDKSTLSPEVEHVAGHIKDKYHLPK